MIYLLTQDKCPNCEMLKAYLQKGLRGAYDAEIQIVHRQTDPELFMNLVQKHKIMSTPAMVAGDDVLHSAGMSNVKAFLDAHITK